MKRILIVIMLCVGIASSTLLTAHSGGKCLPSSKIEGGYTECHAIDVKYNLEKGRITTSGNSDDSDVVFMVRLWDADSMRLDFIAHDLHVNMAYAGDEYKVPVELAHDTKYIEIHYVNDDDEFSPWKEEYKCFNDDYVPWIIQADYDSKRANRTVKCLPKDTTLSICKITERREYDYVYAAIRCYTSSQLASKMWIEEDNGIKVRLPIDSYYHMVNDNVVNEWISCPKGYVPYQDRLLCTLPSELKRIEPEIVTPETLDYVTECSPSNMIGGRCN